MKGSLTFDKIVGEKPPTKAMQKAFNDEYEKFCGIFGNINTVNSINIEAYKGGHDFGGYNPNNGVITIFGAGGDGGMNFLSKVAREHYKTGDWSTPDPMHAFRHELGHAWQKQLKQNDPNYETKIEQIKQMKNQFWEGLTSSDNNAIIDFRKEEQKVLSVYGLGKEYKIDELISESAAEYMRGKPRSFAVNVINILIGTE